MIQISIKDVLLLGNPALRKTAKNVDDFSAELNSVIRDLKDTLVHLQDQNNMGRALAAPQIGYQKQVIYSNIEGKEKIMINPEIVNSSEEKFAVWDSCFSFELAFFVKVFRHRQIVVKYQNTAGRKVREKFTDDLSELYQHEIDHLRGILAVDYCCESSDCSGENIVMREEWEKRYR